MKFLGKGRSDFSTDYSSALKRAREYIGDVERAAGDYLKAVDKGKQPAANAEITIGAGYTLAGGAIMGVERTAGTPAEKAAYEKLKERFVSVSATVAAALNAVATNYLGIARSSMESGDRTRINDEIRRERQEESIKESNYRMDETIRKHLGEEAYQKSVAQRRADEEIRRKQDEEIEGRFPELARERRSNLGYANANAALLSTDRLLETAVDAANNSGSDGLIKNIESLRGVLGEIREELESKLK